MNKYLTRKIVKKIILIVFFVFLLFPLYFMIIGSFRDTRGTMKMPPDLLPKDITLENYIRIFKYSDIFIYFWNSLKVTVLYTVLTIIITCFTGYAFAFYKFKFKNFYWKALLIGIMIPRMSMFIPLYVIMRKIGLSGTHLAVILPCLVFPMFLYITRNYFETIPLSLLESARLDGANELQILLKVVGPLSKPIVTAIIVFSSINALGDFLWQNLVLQVPDKLTMIVGLIRYSMLRGMADERFINFIGRQLAVGVLLFIPIFIIFLVANKYFVSSLSGAVKE